MAGVYTNQMHYLNKHLLDKLPKKQFGSYFMKPVDTKEKLDQQFFKPAKEFRFNVEAIVPPFIASSTAKPASNFLINLSAAEADDLLHRIQLITPRMQQLNNEPQITESS